MGGADRPSSWVGCHVSSPSTLERVRILLVEDGDDDAELISRMLMAQGDQDKPELQRATRLTQALDLLASRSFGAVLLDLGLPDASGLQALDAILRLKSGVAVILLTGLSERELGLEAVQRGAQDYLVKGHITGALLERSIRYGRERARILNEQREFLERTLRGSVDALVSVLALADPAAFGRATRIKRYAQEMAEAVQMREQWPIEVAAVVSQLGWIQMPPETCQKAFRGEELSAEEQELVNRVPCVALDLLEGIPHLDPVTDVLAHLVALRTQGPAPSKPDSWTEASRGARIVQMCLEYDALECARRSAKQALLELRGQWNERDPALFRTFARLRLESGANDRSRPLPIQSILPGMILDEDVLTKDGRLLVTRGQEVTKTLLSRLHAYAHAGDLRGPILASSARADSAA